MPLFPHETRPADSFIGIGPVIGEARRNVAADGFSVVEDLRVDGVEAAAVVAGGAFVADLIGA
ncbi:hypothetical protein KKF45_03520, partial [Patescibacteria group bacterium]|nr:hypothetical protein [Patescibacteria group bacterium]